MSMFPIANRFTKKWERGLVDHPNDPGGITNNGASLKWLQDINADIDGDGDVDGDDVRALVQDQIDALFKTNFWDPLGCEDMPLHIAVSLYDCAVNTGPGQAVKFLQRALGVNADGKIGPVTRRAIAECQNVAVAKLSVELRKQFYTNLANSKPRFQVFLKGWHNRANDLLRYLDAI